LTEQLFDSSGVFYCTECRCEAKSFQIDS